MSKGMAFVFINEATKYTYLFGFVENYVISVEGGHFGNVDSSSPVAIAPLPRKTAWSTFSHITA